MSGQKAVSRTEGDVNLGEGRAVWQKSFLDNRTRKRLDEDAEYFLHQALSTKKIPWVAPSGTRSLNTWRGTTFWGMWPG
jgi:hypothetical protein